ncbi:MAG: hypothetical protein AABY22_27690, partial [Nanoarchaeota archaeon]
YMIHRIISHRGNLQNAIPEQENHPNYIDKAIEAGFHVEVDIRNSKDGFSLGHDKTDYLVTAKWILRRKRQILFHAKDIESGIRLRKLNSEIKYFMHLGDPFVLISNGLVWVHDLSLLSNDRCIIPLIDKNSIDNFDFKDKMLYGVCTDEPIYLKEKLERNNII